MKNSVRERVSNLKELRAEKIRLQSQIDFSKHMLSLNLNMSSLKNTAINSLPFDTNSIISSGITKTFFGKSKGMRGVVIGFLVPLLVPKITSLIFKFLQRKRK